jgi:hypothetical protein
MTLVLCLWSEFSLFLDLQRVGVLNKRGVLWYDSWAWFHPGEHVMLALWFYRRTVAYVQCLLECFKR